LLENMAARVDKLTTAEHGVYPSLFGCPSVASFDPVTGFSTGAAFVMSPLAAAVAEPAND